LNVGDAGLHSVGCWGTIDCEDEWNDDIELIGFSVLSSLGMATLFLLLGPGYTRREEEGLESSDDVEFRQSRAESSEVRVLLAT